MLNKRLQTWLALSGTSRAELAAMLHISPRTVDGWLGSVQRPIPHRMHAAIEKIIEPSPEPGHIARIVAFTPEEWAMLETLVPEGQDKQEYIKKMILGVIVAARPELESLL